MKTYTQYFIYAATLMLLIFAGCSSVTSNDDENNIKEEDLEIAAEVVGESLSDQYSGAMASVYDALSGIDANGMQYRYAAMAMEKNRNGNGNGYGYGNENGNQYGNGYGNGYGRGMEKDYEYVYDPATGTHTIDFTRSIERENFTKSVTGHLEYIFSDPEGTFVVYPRANPDSIETIDFKGIREGESESPGGESSFTRVDTLFFSGLHNSSDLLRFEGTHYGEGMRSRTPAGRPDFSTEYDVNFEFIDITIDKAIVEENGTLEEGVTGTVNYSVIFTTTVDGEASEKVVEGTVEFMGDGTGLLRFKKFVKIFRLSLYNGETIEE